MYASAALIRDQPISLCQPLKRRTPPHLLSIQAKPVPILQDLLLHAPLQVFLYIRNLLTMTENSVIVTLGAEGTYYCSKDGCGHVPGVTAHQIDTIGAGDSHIGAVIACKKLGKPLPEAICMANRVAARVVETQGALLPDEEFEKISF